MSGIVGKLSLAPLAALLFVVASLSGCAGKGHPDDHPGDTDPGPTTPVEPFLTMPMDVHDCSFIMAVVPVMTSDVAAYLPEDFTPISASDLGIPAPEDFAQGKDALLGIEAESCERVLMPDGSYAAGPTGSYWIPVKPPETMMHRGADFYVVKLDVLGWDAGGVEMLKAAGLLAYTGTTSFTEPFPTSGLPQPPADAETWGMNWYSATLNFEGGESINYQGGGSIAKYFVASPFQKFTCYGFFPIGGDPANGVIEGQTDFEASVIHESMGLLTVTGSGTAADIIGTGEHNFYALVGYGGYYNQEMYLPNPDAQPQNSSAPGP